MLDELKSLKNPGGQKELLYFISHILLDRQLPENEIYLLCSHAPSNIKLSGKDILDFCRLFNIVKEEKAKVCLSSEYLSILSNKELLVNQLVTGIVNKLFEWNVFTPRMFEYNLQYSSFVFLNQFLAWDYSVIRNFLTTTDLFLVERIEGITKFVVNVKYQNLVANYIKEKNRTLTLDQLKRQLENNEIAGDKAEIFVIEYEKKRLGFLDGKTILRVSEFDVTAGYDIASYCSSESTEYDRFIEVKAVNKEYQFFWSRNEYEKAKIYGEKYYLYLVELSKISDEKYIPQITKNPSKIVMNEDNFLVETENYKITKINN